MAERLYDQTPALGYRYVYRGVAKKKGGIGKKVTGKTKRWFKLNVQRVKIILPDGTVKRVWLTARQLKNNEFTKAPKQSLAAKVRAEVREAKAKK